MLTLKDIENTAEAILAKSPDPVVKVRLLRDVLMTPTTNSAYRKAKAASLQSAHVRQLTEAQCDNGSWGRFHTKNTKARGKFPTTEFAVSRGVALGLDKRDPVFRKAIGYMVAVLERRARWADGYEKSPLFPLAVDVFTAAKLAKIDPRHRAMDKLWNTWFEILQSAFARGAYDGRAEGEAAERLLGVNVAGSYVGLRSVHNVEFLAARSASIPKKLQRAYVKWLWHHPRGLVYLQRPLSEQPKDASYKQVEAWLSSLDAVSGFAAWRGLATAPVGWLGANRAADGLWDFGPRGRSPHYPLSESWRKRDNRGIDYSTRVLALLRKGLA